MALKFYTNSVSAWDAMLSGVKNARSSIYIEMYEFLDDTRNTHDFVGVLISQALAGVEIVLILDAFGSMNLNDETIDKLESHGVQIFFYHHFLNRTHRKLIVIDGQYSFLGGTNISENSRTWFDIQVSVGKRATSHLVHTFIRAYKNAGGKKVLRESGLKFEKKSLFSYIIEHTPGVGKKKLHKYYKTKINNAENSIILISPYFVPGKWFSDSIKRAISRRVKVEIIVPKSTDHKILDIANLYYATKYSKFGCTIYFGDIMNHAKAMLIDEKEGMVGSGNLDNLSFERNSELGIFFKDKASVRNLSKILHSWIQNSNKYDSIQNKFAWYQIILMPLLRLIFPFL